MEKPDYVPDYRRIKIVGNMPDLKERSFGPENIILFPRRLSGDFNALAHALGETYLDMGAVNDILCYDLEKKAANMDAALREAAAHILEDMDALGQKWLKIIGHDGYQGKNRLTHRFHQDGVFSRILCSYTAPTTEFLANEDAQGPESFYGPKPGAQPFSFMPGDLVHMTGRFFEGVPAVIHRGPRQSADGPPRLFLKAN